MHEATIGAIPALEFADRNGEISVTMLQLVVLALVQGVTEFLPISSSGHLILVPALTDWPDQGLQLDVAVHVGTLLAVLIYFWREVGQAASGALHLITGRHRSPGARLCLLLIVGTVPLVIVGLVLHEVGTGFLRSAELIAWTTIIFGLALWGADHVGMTVRRLEHMTWGNALVIGLAQVLALLPGTSRAGITMTAARMLGYERPDAARFSMLLSIPAILAAGTVATLDLVESGDARLTQDALIAGGLAFVSALVSIALLMAWLKRAGMAPFALYRVVLGGGLLYLIYSGSLGA